MTAMGAACFGVVWGWLALALARPPASSRTLIAAGVATAAAIAAAFWIGGARAVWFAGAGMLAGFAAHAAWRAGLKRLAQQNN